VLDFIGPITGLCVPLYKRARRHRGNHTRDLFLHDASSGQLPAVSWVYATAAASASTPGKMFTDGMRWTVDQVMRSSPAGSGTRRPIFITWDDWGGWFDHVDPPVIEKWNRAHAHAGGRAPGIPTATRSDMVRAFPA